MKSEEAWEGNNKDEEQTEAFVQCLHCAIVSLVIFSKYTNPKSIRDTNGNNNIL